MVMNLFISLLTLPRPIFISMWIVISLINIVCKLDNRRQSVVGRGFLDQLSIVANDNNERVSSGS